MSAKLSTPKFAVSVAKDLDMLSALVATELVTAAREAIEERGEFWVAVSGGSLPQVLMRGLEKVDMSHLEPDKWRVVFADERVVPLDDSESNFRALRAVLVDALHVPRERILAIQPELPAAKCAEEYEQRLRVELDGKELVLDLALLGMGPDGHTASLFPDHPLLKESSRWVMPIIDSPKPPPQRVTLTLPVLNNARQAFFVASGDSKAEALRKVLPREWGGMREEVAEASQLPAARVEAQRTVWLIDPAAAQALDAVPGQ